MRGHPGSCPAGLGDLRKRIDRVYTSQVTDAIRDLLARCTGFEWDDGNAPKVVARHQVTPGECEQVFFREPLLLAHDPRHSIAEERWAALGQTADGRLLTIIFTIREDRIRPLSARDMNRKERERYAEAQG
jgi:uncharacterized protein